MAENWEDDLRRSRRRSLFRWAVGVGLVILVGIPLGMQLTTHRGARSAALKDAPGFRGEANAPDTSPFDFFKPAADGSTTIPGGPGGTDGDATTVPDTKPPQTLPPQADYDADDPACNAVAQIYDLYRESGELGNQPQRLATVASERLTKAVEYLNQTGDPAYVTGSRLLQDAAQSIVSAQTTEEIAAILQPLLLQSTPEVRAASAPMNAHVQRTCPDLVKAHIQ